MTTNIFDQIALGWYNFRHWSIFAKELEALARRWQKGSLLNVGCAHGPDFLPFRASPPDEPFRQNFTLYGIDSSLEMLRLAQRYSRKFDFIVNRLVADARYLPFADEAFDWAISVATYHHIKGEVERQAALGELRRVLKPNGEAFITVWNRWQSRFWLSSREVSVPWRTQDKTLLRYYYLFSYPELERQAKQAGFQVVKSFPESSPRYPAKFFSRNICLLVRKSD